MNYNQRLQKLNSEYVDAQVFHDNEEINRICELALDLCEEMQMLPEIKWIPCSERLPSEIGYYIGCWKHVNGGMEVEELCFVANGNWEGRNCYTRRGVIAWQPLPEPYKENVDS